VQFWQFSIGAVDRVSSAESDINRFALLGMSFVFG
jgi:hypothetical protein